MEAIQQHREELIASRENRLKALPLDPPPMEPLYGAVSHAAVQKEWEHTLERLSEVCEVMEASPVITRIGFVRLFIRRTEGMDIEAIERILFDNLLLAIWNRTEDEHKVYFGGEWLWHWRKAVPWKAEKVGYINRLSPWQPQHQWTYRFNIEEAVL